MRALACLSCLLALAACAAPSGGEAVRGFSGAYGGVTGGFGQTAPAR